MSTTKLRRSSSAITVRMQNKPPSPPHEAPRHKQSAVIIGRRSDRAPPKISLISPQATDESQEQTPIHEPAPPETIVSPIVAQLEAREQELESEEETWNLLSFSSADAETAMELRANSKEVGAYLALPTTTPCLCAFHSYLPRN